MNISPEWLVDEMGFERQEDPGGVPEILLLVCRTKSGWKRYLTIESDGSAGLVWKRRSEYRIRDLQTTCETQQQVRDLIQKVRGTP